MRLRSDRLLSISGLAIALGVSGCASFFSTPLGARNQRTATDNRGTHKPYPDDFKDDLVRTPRRVESSKRKAQTDQSPAETDATSETSQDPKSSSDSPILQTSGVSPSATRGAQISGIEEVDDNASESPRPRRTVSPATLDHHSPATNDDNRQEPASKDTSRGLGALRSLWPARKSETEAEDPANSNTPWAKSISKGVSQLLPRGKGKNSEADGRTNGQIRTEVVDLAAVKAAPLSRLAPASGLREMEIQKLISLLEAESAPLSSNATARERHAHVQRQVQLRLLYLMSDQPQKAQQAVAGISPQEQEFWTDLFWGLSNYFGTDANVDDTERVGRMLGPLSSAQRHLQDRAKLELRNVSLCNRIDAFGAFAPFDRDEFLAGQSVLVYAELRNFQAQLTDAGIYRTAIKSTVELLRTPGKTGDFEVSERIDFPVTEDESRSPRSDYYHSYRIDLPQNLSPGRYSLRLTVVDQLSHKTSTSNVPFAIRERR